MTFSRPVSSTSTPERCATTPIERRTRAACVATSKPATRAEPPSARASVVSTLTAVDLPAPFGPSRPKIVPGATANVSPSRAWTSPYRFVRPSPRSSENLRCKMSRTSRYLSYRDTHLSRQTKDELIRQLGERGARRAGGDRPARRSRLPRAGRQPHGRALPGRHRPRGPGPRRAARGGQRADDRGRHRRHRPPRQGRLRPPPRRSQRPPPRARRAHAARARARGGHLGAARDLPRDAGEPHDGAARAAAASSIAAAASTTSSAPPRSASCASSEQARACCSAPGASPPARSSAPPGGLDRARRDARERPRRPRASRARDRRRGPSATARARARRRRATRRRGATTASGPRPGRR